MAKVPSSKKRCDSSPVTLALTRPPRNWQLLRGQLRHPARVRILRVLMERQACVCGEIVNQLPLAQSTVSQHLKILKRIGSDPRGD